jgi:hypothetical protein
LRIDAGDTVMTKEEILNAFATLSADDQKTVRTKIMESGEGSCCCGEEMQKHMESMMKVMQSSENPMEHCSQMMQMCQKMMQQKMQPS